MPSIPAPPPDNSGGYMITKYTNGVDTHKARTHLRAFDTSGVFSAPSAAGNPNVPAEWTAFMGKFCYAHNNAWTFNLESVWKNNGDGTFTELFGYTPPAPVTGFGAVATPTDQERAVQVTMTFHDGFGGRYRLTLLGIGGTNTPDIPTILAGAAGGSAPQQLVDYLSTASKTNIVSRNGHVVQSPVRQVVCVNRRLRRHYGYA